ncbi:PREDICTED: probable Werner syndrome ATP-dependent helicase homolog 1 [Branchiostoma belcheri]|uniref:DNA 3'-5' helicase n=1 Tax=Branchiostoma belcheri TaxID=7741 RepID=A0A6P4YEM2_BRABE|nr:PREDICTED: probable Werner syndrome ATP-dependent helicase homolog 1 [Branchiostoma belcheri]
MRVHLDIGQCICRRRETSRVFMAPEQAVSTEGRQLMQKPPLPIALVAVDEAHCIHEWGDDFRRTFKELGSLRAVLSLDIPFMALTATATTAVLKTVKTTLHMDEPVIVKGCLDRPNIHLQLKSIKRTKEDLQPLVQHIVSAESVEDIKKHLVYAKTKKMCMDLWEVIRGQCSGSKKKAVRAFHADISTKAKTEILEGFRSGAIRIVVSTIAFGMGIDIPDVHGVVVYHVPTTIGQLYQEIGRAGRDGEQATATIFHGKADLSKAEEDVKAFVQTTGCLREELLKHLGQDLEEPPENCCTTEEDPNNNGLFIFLQQANPEHADQTRPRAPNRKQRQDTKRGDELKAKLREMRDSWFEERPELQLFGPVAVLADEVINTLVSKCRGIHNINDLKKIKGVQAKYAAEIIGAFDQFFPECPPRRVAVARRQRGAASARRALQDITNVE